MSVKLLGAVARAAAVVVLVWSSTASAVLVTNSGVETTSKRYTIGASSTVSYQAGFFGGGTVVGPLPISGQFDAVFSRYWWEYRDDSDPQGQLGTFLAESTWVQFKNPDVALDNALSGFGFPAYFVRRHGDQLSGDDHPCTFPFGPDTLCSGFILGPLSQLTGQIASDGRLTFAGFQPTSFFFDGYTYQVDASAVSLPASVWLVAAGLGLLRRRERGFRS